MFLFPKNRYKANQTYFIAFRCSNLVDCGE